MNFEKQYPALNHWLQAWLAPALDSIETETDLQPFTIEEKALNAYLQTEPKLTTHLLQIEVERLSAYSTKSSQAMSEVRSSLEENGNLFLEKPKDLEAWLQNLLELLNAQISPENRTNN